MKAFPEGFLWGAATSAYPTEGGGFDSDWWRWEQRPGRIRDGSSAKFAGGLYECFEDDLDLMRKLGYRAYLFSLEWSRIQPARGLFDESAITHYHAVFDGLASRGIEPVCVLHHVSLPAWLAARGGWAHPRAARLFGQYAERVAAEYAGRCRWWIPILEPMHALNMAYVERIWPPASANLPRAVRALRNLVRAHGSAYQALHARQPEAMVGVSVRGRVFAPLDADRAWDLRTARREQRRCNHWFPEAVQRGGLLPWRRRRSGGQGPFDFLALSYYGSERIRFSAVRPFRLFSQTVAPEGKALRHAEPTPDSAGLESLIDEMGSYGVPILIAGNGVAADDDRVRCRFLLDHVATLERRIEKGADVQGYFYYALLDGFEWAEGLSPRYGLIHVDQASLARTPNPSAYLYKDICENNGLRAGVLARFCPGWRAPADRTEAVAP